MNHKSGFPSIRESGVVKDEDFKLIQEISPNDVSVAKTITGISYGEKDMHSQVFRKILMSLLQQN